MYISPSSLQDVCVNCICDHIFELCETVTRRKKAHQEASTSNADYNESNKTQQDVKWSFDEVKFGFRESHVYFPSEISDQLLRTLCLKGKLSDQTLTLFDPENTRLRYYFF